MKGIHTQALSCFNILLSLYSCGIWAILEHHVEPIPHQASQPEAKNPLLGNLVKILTTLFSPGHVFRSMPTFLQKTPNLCQRKQTTAYLTALQGFPPWHTLLTGCLATRKHPRKLYPSRGAESTDPTWLILNGKRRCLTGVVLSLHEPLKIFCTLSIKEMKELFYETQIVSNTAISVPVTSLRHLWTPNPENILSSSPGNSDLLH